MRRETCLSNISYVLGERKPINSLTRLKNDPELLELFKSRGLQYFTESQESAKSLAIKALSGAVRSNKRKIQRLIYTTDAFYEEEACPALR